MRDVPLDKLYEESLSLLERARDHVAAPSARARGGHSPDNTAFRALETTRLTALLTDCTAWLLLWLAIRGGELERRDGLAFENRLFASPVMQDGPSEPDLIDAELHALLDSAKALHRRLRGYERRMMDA